MPTGANCDEYAHKRITDVEANVAILRAEQQQFKAAMDENTRITRDIAENTKDMVDLMKGGKVLRQLLVWAVAIWAAWKFIISEFIK